MRNQRPLVLGFCLLGLLLVLVSIFAELLGLDKNPGSWSRGRIGILIAGMILLVLAWLFVKYSSLFNLWGGNRFFNSPCSKYGDTLPWVILVLFIYAWFISSGTITKWVSPTHYYANLARGFRLGNLYIPTRPDPLLSKLQDPYDPSQRIGVEAPIDITYFNEKYYLYWGPAPALILLIVQWITGGRVGDLQLVYFFVSGTFLFQYLLLIFLWDHFFQSQKRWLLVMSICVTGLAGPVLYMLSNFNGARIYEASVAGGQMFLLGGLFFLILGMSRSSSLNGGYFMPAGIFLILAMGSRLSLMIPIGAVSLVFMSWILLSGFPALDKIKAALLFTVPMIFGLTLLGWYNWARFGSPTETGLYYQLAGNHIQKNYHDLAQLVFIPQNLFNYLIQSPSLSNVFPFLNVEYGRSAMIIPNLRLPEFYSSQQIVGLVFLDPFLIYGLFMLLLGFFRKRKASRSQAFSLDWVVVLLSALSFSAFLFLACFFWAAMRYMYDFLPSMTLLAVVGFWQGLHYLDGARWRGKLAGLMAGVVSFVSIAVSILAAISVNDLRFLFLK